MLTASGASSHASLAHGSRRAASATALQQQRFARHQRRQPRLHVSATATPEVEEETEEAKIAKLLAKPYKYGFKTIIESDVFPKGLSEDVVRAISAKKEEPEWLLEFRCGAAAAGRQLSRWRSCLSAVPIGDPTVLSLLRTAGRTLQSQLPSARVLTLRTSALHPPAAAAAAPRRLKAYRKWLTMEEPAWSDNRYPPIDYQGLSYYSAPKTMEKKKSLDEVWPPLGSLSVSWEPRQQRVGQLQ